MGIFALVDLHVLSITVCKKVLKELILSHAGLTNYFQKPFAQKRALYKFPCI